MQTVDGPIKQPSSKLIYITWYQDIKGKEKTLKYAVNGLSLEETMAYKGQYSWKSISKMLWYFHIVITN